MPAMTEQEIRSHPEVMAAWARVQDAMANYQAAIAHVLAAPSAPRITGQVVIATLDPGRHVDHLSLTLEAPRGAIGEPPGRLLGRNVTLVVPR